MSVRDLVLSAAGSAGTQPLYVEDVFSTYVYAGNGGSQTFTNNIDLSTEGGLVWIKKRNGGSDNYFQDTVNGANSYLITNSTAALETLSGINFSFLTNGFSLNNNYSAFNGSTDTYASWSFRKAEKFFDVVTWTGNGASTRTISHNLGSQPGAIFLKRTDSTGAWAGAVKNSSANSYWAGEGSTTRIFTTEASGSDVASDTFVGWSSTDFKPTNFGFNGTEYNINGATYVAYLFAHDAGGFGNSGSESVIKCGSFTTDGSGNATIDLGWEPQWFLRKRTDSTGNWTLVDNMRGFTADGTDAFLYPNLSNAEATSGGSERLTSTGVRITGFGASISFIYIAIRRGPMKTPEAGTEVFYPYAAASPGNAVVTTGFPVDLQFQKDAGSTADIRAVDRLRGVSSTPTSPSAAFPFLVTSTTAADSNGTGTTLNWNNTGFTVGNTYSTDTKHWAVSFRRAPGFFDVVCYSGTGSNTTVTHNLGVVPELMIVKRRDTTSATGWIVYAAPLANAATSYLVLNLTDAVGTSNTVLWNSTAPTSSVFSLGTSSNINASGSTNVAYLFASVTGVSKVGSYTGTGTTLQVNCGFTGGARFVMIKRADASGDWYVWDSARGIVSGNDPYLLLNSTAAEVTNTDYIDTFSSGFEISSTAPAAINANGGTFIFLAIA